MHQSTLVRSYCRGVSEHCCIACRASGLQSPFLLYHRLWHATNLPGIVEYALDLMAVISRHAPLVPAFVGSTTTSNPVHASLR